MDNIIICGKGGAVAKLKLLINFDEFVTPATRIDFLAVTRFPLACHCCHRCHKEKKKASEDYSLNRVLFGVDIKSLFFDIEALV